MKTAYLGTSAFAAEVLRRLASGGQRPALVVTPPDRPAGRGRTLTAPPAAEAARELGIELHQTPAVNDEGSVALLRALGPDAVAVCAFGQLIGEPLLSELTMLNVHPSLIPRWRGAAPIERAIMAGDERTGVTIMRVTEELDGGPVALQRELPIEGADTYGTLSERLQPPAAELLAEAFERLADGSIEFAPQDESAATYAEKIAPEERRLDPARPAVELERAVRALSPHIGTFLELEDGARLGVREAIAVAEGPGPGELEATGDSIVLGCGSGALRIEAVQPPGKGSMSAADFLRGHRIPSRAA